jgi:SAM-dependent methyltransferase
VVYFGPVEGHSAAFFGPERDFWWNHDYLQLIARRRELEAVRAVLDVGSGVGHWGRLVATLVSPDATVVGVEPDAGWVEEATRRAPPNFSYVQGVAEQLPFADASFDLVTCQTVLIHVADPRAAIREMLRVTKPGGQLLVAEPNNKASYVVGTSVEVDIVDALGFVTVCERGKVALGEGDNSAGDLIPGYFALEGLQDIGTWIADKPATMIPPYAREDMQAFKGFMVEQARAGTMGWTREEAERYYTAGGGENFDAAWERRMAEGRAAAGAVQAGTFHSAGGMLMYVIAGRRAQ